MSGPSPLHRRGIAVAVALVAGIAMSGCSPQSAQPATTADQAVLSVAGVARPPSGEDMHTVSAVRGTWSDATVDAVAAALGRAGVAVVSDPGSKQAIAPVTGPVLLTLLAWQVHSMAREAHLGGGIPGAQLDQSIPAPAGTVQYSAFLAAWVSHWDSPRATLAHAVMGAQDWTNGAGIVWPTLVLTLFQVDATAAAAQDTGSVDPLRGLPPPAQPAGGNEPPESSPQVGTPTSSPDAGSPAASPTRAAGPESPAPSDGAASASPAPTDSPPATAAAPVIGATLAAFHPNVGGNLDVAGACQSVASFVSNIVNDVAAKLKVDPASINTGSGVGNHVLSFFASLWNIAVTSLQVVVNGAVQVFNATVLGWLRAGVGVIGIVVQLSTLFKPLDLHVNGAPSSATFALDSAPDVTGTVAGYLNEPPDLVPYPSFITGCASAVGVDLPQRGIKGANFQWSVADPQHLVTITTPQSGVASSDTVTVHWLTGRQTSVDVGSGDSVTDPVVFTLSLDNRVLRQALEALKSAALALIGHLGVAAGPVASVVQPYVDRAIGVITATAGISRSWTLPITHSKHVTCRA